MTPKNKISVEVSKYYKFSRTKTRTFKVIAINRKENFVCIVYDNKKHETVAFDYLNNGLIKGRISEINISKKIK